MLPNGFDDRKRYATTPIQGNARIITEHRFQCNSFGLAGSGILPGPSLGR